MKSTELFQQSLYFTERCYNHFIIETLFPPGLSRYARVTGGEGASTVHHDQPVDQPEGAAPGSPRRAEEDGCVTAGEAEAADGAGQAAAGAGTGPG